MFGKLFGSGSKKPAPSASTGLSQGVRDAIFGIVGARSIPPMPPSAQKAFQISINPAAEAYQFVEVIESDEGLSARILKVANSVFFERGHKSATIEEAVLVIGVSELRNLLNATCLAEIFPSQSKLRSVLWQHDIATAIAARELARVIVPRECEAAFLGGLMHDIGKLLLVQRAPEKYAEVVRIVEKEGAPFYEAESQIFPFDHCEVGQLIGERWNFSADLLEIIRSHHNAHDAGSSCHGPAMLALVIQAADAAAYSLGLGVPASWGRLRSRMSEALPGYLDLLGLSREQRKPLLDNIARTFEVENDLYARAGNPM